MGFNNGNSGIEQDLEEAILQTLATSEPQSKKSGAPPDTLYLFPIVRRPFFPGMAAPLMVEQGPFYEVLKASAKSENKFIGLVMTKDEMADINNVGFNDLHHTGVLARILRIIPMEQGGAQVILNMEKRISLIKPVKGDKHLLAKVAYHSDEVLLNRELKAYAISIISTIKELLKLNPLFKEELQIFLSHSDFTEPGKLADFAVALTTATRDELQEVLDTYDIPNRIDKALVLLKKELDLSRLQNSINQKIETTINKSQKEFYLREQLKTIKRELGIEKDDKTSDREKFEGRLKKKEVPDDVKAVIAEELEKIGTLEPQSAEYALSRNYLDWLTNVPWGVKSPDIHNMAEAEKILEKDHYGLADLKQRILEFIGVAKLSGSLRGSILCLVGPPGVGKTSIGKSIARALNRKFFRFSVGGIRDEAEIKGHRRTYIGAMPGKIIQALKVCQTMNPVIMLDEVDKIGSSYHGDPASALLEVLDPEQNSEFLDHYLDVRCNLSDILFIVTANMLDSIPEALVDRMEVMRLSGYIMEEKLEIAKRYLIPKNRKHMGLKATQVEFTKPALRQLINGYARESGVRTLENSIKKILRKLALEIVRQNEVVPTSKRSIKKEPAGSSYTITPEELPKYVGKPVFHSDRIYEETPVGICAGLAWTSMGGATLYVESIKIPSEKTEMKLTGQAGQVMKESSEIAWSYLHGAVHKYAPGHTFFEKSQVHIHIPEGATPKDGPSAGVTMVTSLISLLRNEPVMQDLCMTGELTLTGRVLPIGGVKEKIVAAKRSGLKVVIFPKDNLRDIEELSDEIKKGINIHFVEHYDEVFKIAFPDAELPAI
ncbi:MAG: endopeptidase La [Verrucomicrobia bacterium]|nr:endopeptidase La [Verrucomicrobiota bacterium]